MIFPLWIRILAASPFFLPLSAEPVELVLAPGGGFDVTYSLSTGPTTSGRDDLSGHILADARVTEFDEVGFFKMTGGRIAHSDETLALVVPPFYEVRLITQGVATLPWSDPSGGWVDAGSGIVSNAGHRMISNEGTTTTQQFALGSLLGQEVRDLSSQPDNAALVGTTTLTAAVLDSSPWWKRCRIDLLHERNEGRTLPAVSPGLPTGTTYTVYEAGSFTASGEGLFPGNDFIGWALVSRGVAVEDFDDLDPLTGQPLLVMYALRAGEGAWQVPVEFRPALQQVVLDLPAAGLRAPVRWEFWSGEASDGWVTLAGGLTPAGAAGATVLALPAGPRGFVRASVVLPE